MKRLSLFVGAALYASLLLLIPPVVHLYAEDGEALTLWKSAVWLLLRWPLVILGLGMIGLTMFQFRQSCRAAAATAILSCVGILVLTSDLLPSVVISTGLVSCGAALLAIVSLIIAGRFAAKQFTPRQLGRTILLTSWLLYSATGFWTVHNIGECYGSDEWSYLFQAASLWNDHDLDVKNEWLTRGNVTPEEAHISPNTQGNHWYSRHPWGLSLMLAPVTPLGIYGRVALLALIAAVTNLGIFRLSLLTGAQPGPAAAIVTGLGLSLFWSFYATRLFTEILGAALVVWFFIVFCDLTRRPLRSMLVCAGFIVLLPIVQFRYVPLAMLLGAMLAIRCLAGEGTVTSRIIRTGLVSLLCVAGVIAFLVFEANLFGVGRDPHWWTRWSTGIILNSTISQDSTLHEAMGFFPLGLWASLTDDAGLLSIFPLLVWLIPAAIFAAVEKCYNRPLILLLIGAALVSWVTSCANQFCVGPGSVPGRYLILAVALLTPPASGMLGSAPRNAQRCFAILSAWSFALLLICLIRLPVLKLGFLDPVHGMSQLEPLLSGLLHPYAQVLQPDSIRARLATLAFVVTALLSTTLLFRAQHKRVVATILTLSLGVAMVAHHFQTRHLKHIESPNQLAARLDTWDRHLMIVLRHATPPMPELAFYDKTPLKKLTIITGEALSTAPSNSIRQSTLPLNDWAGRDLRWATLTKPFVLGHGDFRFQITGREEGDAKLTLAIRQGSRALLEAEVPMTSNKVRYASIVTCSPGVGDIYVLLRLHDGAGTFTLNSLRVTPWGKGLEEAIRH